MCLDMPSLLSHFEHHLSPLIKLHIFSMQMVCDDTFRRLSNMERGMNDSKTYLFHVALTRSL